MTTRRKRIRWLSAGIALPLFAAEMRAYPWFSSAAASRLAVEITGLPDEARPSVAITGSGGSQGSPTASTTLTVPAGSLRLTPAKFKTAQITYYTADDVLIATVERGRSNRVVIDYLAATPDSDSAPHLPPSSHGNSNVTSHRAGCADAGVPVQGPHSSPFSIGNGGNSDWS